MFQPEKEIITLCMDLAVSVSDNVQDIEISDRLQVVGIISKYAQKYVNNALSGNEAISKLRHSRKRLKALEEMGMINFYITLYFYGSINFSVCMRCVSECLEMALSRLTDK